MHCMVADEADAEQGRGQKFFIYGAIFVEQGKLKSLHEEVESARVKAKYARTDSLKFADKTRPAHVSREDHKTLKAEIVKIAAKHDVTFCAYATLHELAKNKEHGELITWGANTLLGRFNEFLKHKDNDVGVVMFDRIPIEHENRYLKEKFQIGLTFPEKPSMVLERILSYSSTCDGASHFSAMVDILVGSFRYCVNEPDRKLAGAAMFPDLVNLMWKGKDGLMDKGLVLRPKKVEAEPHKKEYDELLSRLREYLK